MEVGCAFWQRELGAMTTLRGRHQIGMLLEAAYSIRGIDAGLPSVDHHLGDDGRVPFGVLGTVWSYLKLRELGVRRPAALDWWGNLTFAAGLRSFLRQDPDVILVGEIRDRETAEIAIQAALTGHLVLSTLHTTDVASTISRICVSRRSLFREMEAALRAPSRNGGPWPGSRVSGPARSRMAASDPR